MSGTLNLHVVMLLVNHLSSELDLQCLFFWDRISPYNLVKTGNRKQELEVYYEAHVSPVQFRQQIQ